MSAENSSVRRPPPCGSRIVLRRFHPARIAWASFVVALLIYTGTVFLYRLCFIDMRIGHDSHKLDSAADAWATFDHFVLAMFWVDIFAKFFFSYEDGEGNEVVDLRRIAKHYLRTYFIIDLAACLPDEVLSSVFGSSSSSGVNQGLRIVRMQRLKIQRIARFTRLTRLTRLREVKGAKGSSIMRWFRQQKSLRIMNLTLGLVWVMHILACGWYLCAAFHADPGDTWVARRQVDPDGMTLLDRPPLEQWVSSMYFVLTVFTTVGFGDMSAVTVGEMVYVCMTMAIGAVVHSIVMGEVIGVVTSVDKVNQFLSNQFDLIEHFCSHTELDRTSEEKLRRWIEVTAKSSSSTKYDRDAMKQLIVGGSIPRDLLDGLPSALFSGRLGQNRFLNMCTGDASLPPRLPLLLALNVHRSEFVGGELLYKAQDHPYGLFLVIRGTFSYVLHRPDEDHAEDAIAPPARHVPMNKAGSPWAAAPFRLHHEDADNQALALRTRHAWQPYMLFSHGAYFGDAEITSRPRPRQSSARCETSRGELLVLPKDDFQQLAAEFPHFGQKWVQVARQREKLRRRKEKQACGQHMYYKALAAAVIQGYLRRRRDKTARSAGLVAATNITSSLAFDSELKAESEFPVARQSWEEHIEMRLERLSGDVCEVKSLLQALLDRPGAPAAPVAPDIASL